MVEDGATLLVFLKATASEVAESLGFAGRTASSLLKRDGELAGQA